MAAYKSQMHHMFQLRRGDELLLGPTISPIFRYMAWGIGMVNAAGMARIAASMFETCDGVVEQIIAKRYSDKQYGNYLLAEERASQEPVPPERLGLVVSHVVQSNVVENEGRVQDCEKIARELEAIKAAKERFQADEADEQIAEYNPELVDVMRSMLLNMRGRGYRTIDDYIRGKKVTISDMRSATRRLFRAAQRWFYMWCQLQEQHASLNRAGFAKLLSVDTHAVAEQFGCRTVVVELHDPEWIHRRCPTLKMPMSYLDLLLGKESTTRTFCIYSQYITRHPKNEDFYEQCQNVLKSAFGRQMTHEFDGALVMMVIDAKDRVLACARFRTYVSRTPVLKVDGKIINELHESTNLFFDMLGVEKEMQGKGIGKLLVSAVMSHAQSLGATTVECDVDASNHVAIRFYEGMGMRKRLKLSKSQVKVLRRAKGHDYQAYTAEYHLCDEYRMTLPLPTDMYEIA